MKIASRNAEKACAAPSADWVGVLLYGGDPGLVAERRRQLVAALLGPDGTEMQVTQIPAADARRSPADVEAALTTRGFFAGRQVVVIEGGTDGLAAVLGPILGRLRPDDGFLVVTADHLPARSRLRKAFESGPAVAAIGLYPQPLGAREVEERLIRSGLPGISPDAAAMMADLAGDMDHGAFSQFMDVVTLYGMGQSEPLTLSDIAALSPLGLEGDIDGFVMTIADGETTAVGPRLRRLQAGGATAVGLLIALQRHFRALLTAGSSDAGLSALRPPPMGPRRDRFMRQLRNWNGNRLEQANRLLFDIDGRIRSSAPPPDFALVERTVLRLAMMASR